MILIVDDEESVCWALRRALTSSGQRVATAASAEQAFVEAEVPSHRTRGSARAWRCRACSSASR
jgi:DNA-binding NtrC family response regulator